MHTQQPITNPNEPQAGDADAVERVLRIQRHARYYDDLASFGWWSIARGILLAGGAYPAALIVNYFVFVSLMMLFNTSIFLRINPGEIAAAGLAVLLFSFLGGLIGYMWSAFVTVLTLPVMHLIIWSLKIRPNWIRLGTFCGGLIAFLAVFPVVMQIRQLMAMGSLGNALVTMWMGPGLATILGQIGGARGGYNAAWRLSAQMASRRSLLLLGWSRYTLAQANDEDATLSDGDRPRFQFRTIHLLWVGVWISLLLTVIRLSGIPYELIVPAVLGWLVYQTATLAVGRFLVRTAGPWWARRRENRST